LLGTQAVQLAFHVEHAGHFIDMVIDMVIKVVIEMIIEMFVQTIVWNI
jgi:hypothetical protein